MTGISALVAGVEREQSNMGCSTDGQADCSTPTTGAGSDRAGSPFFAPGRAGPNRPGVVGSSRQFARPGEVPPCDAPGVPARAPGARGRP